MDDPVHTLAHNHVGQHGGRAEVDVPHGLVGQATKGLADVRKDQARVGEALAQRRHQLLANLAQAANDEDGRALLRCGRERTTRAPAEQANCTHAEEGCGASRSKKGAVSGPREQRRTSTRPHLVRASERAIKCCSRFWCCKHQWARAVPRVSLYSDPSHLVAFCGLSTANALPRSSSLVSSRAN